MRSTQINKQLDQFARQTLKEGLAQVPESWQLLFKKMYANGNLELDIDTVVDRMPEDKLDWAMQQVDRSIAKLKDT